MKTEKNEFSLVIRVYIEIGNQIQLWAAKEQEVIIIRGC